MKTTATKDLESFLDELMKWDGDATVYTGIEMTLLLSDGPFKKAMEFPIKDYKGAIEKITEFRESLQCEFRVELVSKIRFIADIDARPVGVEVE